MSRRPLACWALVLALPLAPPLLADCTSGTPVVFEPAPGAKPAKFGPGFTNGLDLYRLPSGERRLIVMENYGYATFGVSAGAAPVVLGYQDMSATVPQQGDGQSIVISLGAAADGSRALVNWKQSPYGTFLMKPNNRSTFDFAGNYPSFRSTAGVSADLFPSGRALAYSLNTTALYVADVTSFVAGTQATQANSIPSEVIPTAPVDTSVNHLTRTGHFLVYARAAGVVVVDARTPGLPGAIPVGLHVTTIPKAAFGLGAADMIANVAAALHPVTGLLYVVAEGATSTGTPVGIGVVSSATAGTLSFQQAGDVFQVPSPYGNGYTTQASALVATDKDVLSFTWEYAKNGTFKLVTLSVAQWGTDLTPDLKVDPSAMPEFAIPQAMGGFATGDLVDLYVAAQQGGIAFPLTCAPLYPVGDVDGDGQVAVSDVFALINFLFAGGPAPTGPADANGDGTVSVGDVFTLVNYLFAGVPLP